MDTWPDDTADDGQDGWADPAATADQWNGWADPAAWADPATKADPATRPWGKAAPASKPSSSSLPSNIADLVQSSVDTGSALTYTTHSDGSSTLTVKPHVSPVHNPRWQTGWHTAWHAKKLRRAEDHRASQRYGCSSASSAKKVTAVVMCANCDIRQPASRCPQVMCAPCCFAQMKGTCGFSGHQFD